MLMYLGELSPDILEVLISTLTRFFSYAVNFHPESQSINKTTHTSSYTYWFLVLSAEILTKCSLSKEMQARHAYLLAVIATRLDEGEACDYLVLTASIYASVISKAPAMCSSPFGADFLRAVMRHHDRLKSDLNHQRSQLRRAVKANEVAWSDIDRALVAFGLSDAAFVPNSTGADDTVAGSRPLSHDMDPILVEGRESGERSRDRGESPSRECRLSYLNGLCLTRLCSHTRWRCISPRSRSGFIIPGRGQFLWIWEKFGQRRSSGKVRYRYPSTALYIGASICTFLRVYFGQPRTPLDLLWAIHDFGDRRPWMTIQGHFKSSEQSFPARHLIKGFDSSINPG